MPGEFSHSSRGQCHCRCATELITDLTSATATAAPAGGEFVYDDAGKLTGILKDNAMDLISPVIPPPSDEELDRY